MTDPVRLGIVGCGSIARAHAAALRFLSDDGIVRVVAAADPDPAGVEQVAQIYGPIEHTGADGRAMVEKYRTAAEQYGYIVAGSNNSRNGPASISAASPAAMSVDLGRRFAVDPRRLYLTGLSGGARLALQIALTNSSVAGVIASSAGFLDNQPRASVPCGLSHAGVERMTRKPYRFA